MTEPLISKSVTELLAPVSPDSPAGGDAAREEGYFKLEMEIGKANPDYVVCVELATQLLNEKSKDLRVASWLCFVWFRLDKITGLQNGILLLTGLLKEYGPSLFPSNPLHRKKALQFLNSARLVKLLEMEKITRENAPSVMEVIRLLDNLAAEAKSQYPDNIPEFKDISKALGTLRESAERILAKPRPQEKASSAREGEAPPPSAAKKPAEETTPAPVEGADKSVAPAALSARDLVLTSEKEALTAVKKALRYLTQEEKDESKRFEPYFYALSRVLVWGRTVPPAQENSITQVGSPDSAIQSKLQEWFANKEWDRLIQSIESNFVDEESGFKFWLKGQRLLCLALENKGGRCATAAEEVKAQLSRLLGRYPDLLRMKFSNQMPFADEETVRWIEAEILSRTQKTEQAVLLPPILGEDYEPLRKEYAAACSRLPQDFEKNMQTLQQGIAGETRPKGRFLRLLNLANFCLAAKQPALAKVYLDRLGDQVEAYQLVEWEPALCLAVWESTLMVNRKLLQAKLDSEEAAALEKQQKALFAKIGTQDGPLALKLASLTTKKGE